MTNEQSQELARVSMLLDKQDTIRTKSIDYMHQVASRLEEKTEDDTNIYAEAIGRIIAKYDDRKFGLGGGWLCLEWFLDYYVAWTLENNVFDKLVQIREMLHDGKYTQRNKYEYFNDCEAFYIKHSTLSLCVFGKSWHSEPRYLVIDVDSPSQHRLYVRRVWRKLKKGYAIEQPTLTTYRTIKYEPSFSRAGYPFFGDARDPGHVLTYTKFMTMKGQCDKTLWDLNAPLWFFFEVNSLWTQITEAT